MMRTALRRDTTRAARGWLTSFSRLLTREALLRQGGTALLLFLCTRAQPTGDLSPFSTACFAAGLFAGLPIPAMLLGCLAGCRMETLGLYAFTPLLGALCVLGGWFAWKLLRSALPARAEKPRDLLNAEDAVCALLAGLGSLTGTLAFARWLPYNVLQSFICAAAALAVAPVLIGALRLNWARETLLPDERMSLILLICLCLLGVRGLPVVGASLAPLAAALLTLYAGGLGAGAGAAAGILTGAALTLCGGDPFIGAALGLCGLLAGMARGLGRYASALAFALGNAVTILYGMGYVYGALNPLGVLAIALGYCLLPRGPEAKLARWLGGAPAPNEGEALTALARREEERRVRALASAFQSLAAGYGDQAGDDVPSEQALLRQLRRRLCEGCPKYASCWDGSNGLAARILVALIGTACQNDPLREDMELPPELNRLCVRGNMIPRRLGGMLVEYARKKRARQATGEYRGALSAQFGQAARILKKTDERLSMPLECDAAVARLAAAALDRAGFSPCRVVAPRGKRARLLVALEDSLWTAESLQRAEECLRAEFGVGLRAEGAPEGQSAMLFAEEPRLRAASALLSRPRAADQPCGDSALLCELPDNRLLLAISDGMGSGARAARESGETVRLLRKLLLAEVEGGQALNAVNGLLLARGGEEMFATVDLCVLDLQRGEALFHKLGACDSLLLRGGTCARVEGGRLPLGILQGVTPARHRLRLRAGDTLVMFSDGVADSALEEDRLWLEKFLRQNARLAPQKLCEALLDAAQAREGKSGDDRTALVVRLSRGQ